MRVLYGIKRKSDNKDFVIIYQNGWEVGEPILVKKYSIIGEREPTERELIDRNGITRPNRVYHYSNVDDLVNDELRSLVIIPSDVEQNMRTYESCRV
jgi:hypothetical protein